MKIHAIVCTRSSDKRPNKHKLAKYFKRCGIELHLLEDQNSIFDAYNETVQNIQPEDSDIIILCHDDIEILLDPSVFVEMLVRELMPSDIGFVGPAGTTLLAEDCVWWDHQRWQQGFHRGLVYHGDNLGSMDATWYGKPGQVVCLDGLFLAAKGRTLKKIKMQRPKEFVGKWDFYDIYYTIQAHKKGLKNKAIPVMMIHHSMGELAGRDSWMKNRQAFSKMFTFPIHCTNGQFRREIT